MSMMNDFSFASMPSISPISAGESSRSASNPSPMQGPSATGYSNGSFTTKRPAEDNGSEIEVKEEDGKPKKQKFTRSRTACLQCRSRKSKCGALPPRPCPNCIEAGLTCQWPAEDGRSSRARLQRQRTSIPGQMGDGDIQGDPGLGTSTPADPDWLDRLLNGGLPTPTAVPPTSTNGTFAPSQSFASTSSFPTTFPTIAPTTINPMLPGPSSQTYYQPSVTGTDPFPPPTQPYPPSAFPSSVDPAQFIWAVSSRLPTVEEGSPNDERSSLSGPSPTLADPNAPRPPRKPKEKTSSDGKIVKVTWWRPHGQTAITPGLKRITLKVRVDNPHDTWRNSSPRPAVSGPGESTQEIFAPDGMPSPAIMRHLLDVFMIHFACQFPFIEKESIGPKIESRTGSVFLFTSIAAIAARFSTHPAIALPNLEPHAYGNVFHNRAKALLGAMLAVPSRETVQAFILLAHTGFANDSESEVWMMTGLAVRMALDLGLHINPPADANITEEDRRLNRLVFWAVLNMDYALAFGVGRSTTFRVEDITQLLPTEEDLHPTSSPSTVGPDHPRSPFPFAAKQMISYGPLINMLNRPVTEDDKEEQYIQAAMQAARAKAIKEYNQLPHDMLWNVGNLQKHSRANQGPIFLHIHLWMHTILASGYLTGTNLLRRTSSKGHLTAGASTKSGAATPNSATANSLWRNSARTIGDILVLSDIINPYSYFALPFVNQAFFVAGCCYVKEIEQTKTAPSTPVGSPRRMPAALQMTHMSPREPSQASAESSSTNTEPGALEPSSPPRSSGNGTSGLGDGKQVDLSRALLTSVATTNISTLQSGLAKQNTYWSGIAWITSALSQRVEGFQEVDMRMVTEKLASFVSLPDAGLVGRQATEGEEGGNEGRIASGLPAGFGERIFASSTGGMTPGLFGSGLTPVPDNVHFDYSESCLGCQHYRIYEAETDWVKI
ncbi:fungal-specific transcription factor domain-domain-containing protein [Naematelia encephala]|uniref:Fungal-specific transcription factor domain-domain-containing protein n=1 Tax=Naematelia encephala TaxID=71784 RepID=A0A1Y2B598_9TREE|nr:fungal-specific transcription factor domain-domain-containing protein [Naematelia encephala]